MAIPVMARRRPTHRGRAVLAGLAGLTAVMMLPSPAGAAVVEQPDRTWGTNGRVLAILRTADRIYVGGTFTAAVAPGGGTVARRNLMALTAAGDLDPGFNPAPSGEVQALAASPDATLIYVGGSSAASVVPTSRRRDGCGPGRRPG